MISYHNNFLISFHSPCNKFTEQRKRRVCNNNVSFITQGFHLITTKIAVTVKIVPFQIVNINNAGFVSVPFKGENSAVCARFLLVILRRLQFKQRHLMVLFILLFFAVCCITRTNQFFQPQSFKILGEILCKITPFWVIARQQNGFTAKHIWIVFQIGIHFFLDIVKHGIKFIIFPGFRFP